MELIWEHIYKNELKVSETEHPVLLTVPGVTHVYRYRRR